MESRWIITTIVAHGIDDFEAQDSRQSLDDASDALGRCPSDHCVSVANGLQ